MFVAINYITCKNHYKPKFEELFKTRAKAIDTMPGFLNMKVLKPSDDTGEYLVISFWKAEDDFKKWTGSAAFIEGHKRGFEDIRIAKEKGDEPPMKSDFKTYSVLTE